jgi:hypothetical protein
LQHFAKGLSIPFSKMRWSRVTTSANADLTDISIIDWIALLDPCLVHGTSQGFLNDGPAFLTAGMSHRSLSKNFDL